MANDNSVSCPHCRAGEPPVWDNELFHFAHLAEGDKLKVCLTPWRENLRRIVRDAAFGQVTATDGLACLVAEVSDRIAARVVEQLTSGAPRLLADGCSGGASTPEQRLAAAHSDERRELRFCDLLRAIELHRQEHGDEYLAVPIVLRVEDVEGELHVGSLYDFEIESHSDEPALVLERARWDWQCDSGPAALAAMLDLSLDGVKPYFLPAYPGYATPSRMLRALSLSARRGRSRYPPAGVTPGHVTASRESSGKGALAIPACGRDAWPRYGLARIQWEGAFKHTRWIGAQRVQHGVDVWDIDLVGSELHADGWCPSEWWINTWTRRCVTADISGPFGFWHITHGFEVERPRSA
jgi:hypothetical protein